MRHLHLDLVGGLSGDMFISGMLDAFPELGADLDRVIAAAGFPDLVSLSVEPFDDGVLTGTRFTVTSNDAGEHHHGNDHHHHHRHYSEIRDTLTGSSLEDGTRDAALKMFRLLAEAEASIHGKEVDEVAFHEVGAWDSIADIVLAAHLVTNSGASSFSVSSIPLGGGFVETQHGRLPVPAPATARLLEGFEVHDDGIEGERVTPTGAVILKFLEPSRQVPAGQQLQSTGYGFGTKRFPGLSNTVRVSVFETLASGQPWQEDEVLRLSFEIDDQTPEELAAAVQSLMALDAVIDVQQQAVMGKKNRQGSAVSVLAYPAAETEVIAACFSQTTTLGVRRELVRRATLAREEVTVYVNEKPYRVKVARRPGGYTAKVEMDDLMKADLDAGERAQVRAIAERLALTEVGEF